MDLKLKGADVNRLIKLVSSVDGGAEKALYRTLKDAQKKGKVEASKQVRTQLNLKKAYVDGKIKTGKISYTNLTARIYASKRGLLLSRFKHRKLKRGGVNVKVKKGGATKRMPGAFLIRGLKNSGATGIAIRKKGKLDVLHGPSVSQVMDTFLPDIE
ncbi:MAG: phage tail protein, partial [Hydrogenovibrio sp.]|uniref:phage tail protein n=1 Tax=Hydrogenovibrio sp. TaxID=2065821 RepID=UPI0028708F05